jgi:hypothetical protein
MQGTADIASLIERHPDMMRLLRAVQALGVPDCWIGAGFVRNAVWDVLHHRAIDCSALSDVDVVYFDRADASPSRDRATEAALAARMPGVMWSVKNQARMHERNGVAPYVDMADAISRWPETATAVAARLSNDRVELLAPLGVGDLLEMIVRPTPAFRARRDEVVRRVAEKNWCARWPKLRIVDTSS